MSVVRGLPGTCSSIACRPVRRLHSSGIGHRRLLGKNAEGQTGYYNDNTHHNTKQDYKLKKGEKESGEKKGAFTV